MSSQRLKSLRIRTRVQDSENHAHGAESPKSNLNKNHIQINKVALTDLTNKNSVNTHFKNMVTASDKDTDSDTGGKKAKTMPQVGRQTRSKGKADVSLNSSDDNQTKSMGKNDSKTAKNPEVVIEEMPNIGENLSNAGKVLRPTKRTAKESSNSCQSSPSASKIHSRKETLQSIHKKPSDVEKENGVPNLNKSSTVKELANSCQSSSKTHPPKELLQSIQEELSDAEKEDGLLKPKNSTKQDPSLSSLDSEMEIVEAPRLTRQTRNRRKSQNTETSNKPQSNLMSPKPTARNADSMKTPVRQTRSQVAMSPILRSTKKSPAAPAAAKTMKPKRKTALEKWMEEAGNAILPDGSPRTCRKSSRLLSTQSNVSTSSSHISEKLKSPKSEVKSPVKLMSPKSGMKLKSPCSASKTQLPKKVPVWKTEPKPDAIKSAPDDIYGFEYDPSDCKPVKKKRTRKPKNDDDLFKGSKVKVAPKQTKRLQRTAAIVTEKPKSPNKWKTPIKSKPTEKPKSPTKWKTPIRSKPTEKSYPMKTTPLLKSVAEKLNNLKQPAISEDPEVEDPVAILNFSPIANHSSNVYDTTLPEETDSQHYEPCLDEQEKSTESGVLAGDFENEDENTKTLYSQVEMDMEHLFGFEEEPENQPPVPTKQIEKQLVKSTPIKQQTVDESISSVSPVLLNRKCLKDTRKSIFRPARIDENVARDLIYGIRPLQPVKEKQNATTLMQYIQEVGENHEEKEHAVRRKIVVQQTPPSAFTEPARKSYSKREMRNVKRKIVLGNDDEYNVIPFDDDDEEEEVARKKPKKPTGKTGQKKNKRDKEDKEIDQWSKVLNLHFEDVDKFNLSSY